MTLLIAVACHHTHQRNRYHKHHAADKNSICEQSYRLSHCTDALHNSFIRNRLDYKVLSKYDIWVAQYSSTCTCPLPYGIWQYSSRNALGIPGYGTSLDCNRVYKDYEQLMIQAGLQGHTAPTPEDTTPNKLDKQRITIGRISSGDRATIRALCEGLGLIAAGLYHETCADGNQWMLDVGPVSSGDAWYIMRKCAELQLIDAGLYKAEYVED